MRILRPGHILIIGLVSGGVAYVTTGTFHWAYLTAIGTFFGLYFFSDQPRNGANGTDQDSSKKTR